MILKDEEIHLQRCIDSFKDAYDELIVIDTGSKDNTIEIAKKNGAKVESATWNNNFAEARQKSFDAATMDFCLWCDADDVLREGDARKIRQVVEKNVADVHFFNWRVRDHIIERERLIRKGCGRWERPIHELFRPNKGTKWARVPAIEIHNLPLKPTESSHERNTGLLIEKTKDSGLDFFYLATEFNINNEMVDAARCARAALEIGGIGIVEQYELYLVLAFSEKVLPKSLDYSLKAYSLMPQRREALIVSAQICLKQKDYKRALAFCRAYMSLYKPSEPVWTLQGNWYDWKGICLFRHILCLNGFYEEACKVEDFSRKDKSPIISLIHATRGRPEKMVACLDLWLSKADNPLSIEHIFSIDEDDKEVVEVARGYKHILNKPGHGCIAAWNKAANACCGNILIQLSDDWIPPIGWDTIITTRLGDKINEEAVLAISDGIIREDGKMTDCLCMAIMTRDRLLAQGHMFYPEYKSVYSDNEFTDRAYADNVVVEARDIIFQHEHPINGNVPFDKTYVEQNAKERYQSGNEIYMDRKINLILTALNFEYAAMILATKDDFCLKEVCQRLQEEGVKQIFIGIPDEYWNGNKNPESDIDQVVSIASSINARIFHLNVSKHRAEGRHILETEGLLRNEFLQDIRKEGFEHVVVADGDEIWKRGTLKMIDRYVYDNRPTSIVTKMVPVAGLPGYPIEGANDWCMVYLNKDTKFNQCRSSEGEQHFFPRRQVIHFTATRKTMEEIIQKHRKSGHYGDCQYPFEDWFVHTLPFIKPGKKRCHPFTQWDAWPEARQFTKEEWNEIPESIHKYLGEPK